MLKLLRISSIVLPGVLSAVLAQLPGDPVPYAPIAPAFADTLEHYVRDSLTAASIGRIVVNQAGYRPADSSFNRFYYIGTPPSTGFDIVNELGGASVATGTLLSTGHSSTGQVVHRCYHKAQLVPNGQLKYEVRGPLIAGTVYEGILPAVAPGKYRIKIGAEVSAPFVVSAGVYSMVKDALLKYYGLARCGDNESWFHDACHVQDPTPGGWHDAGDHLKSALSIGYVMSVLGLAAAVYPQRDTDSYAFNQRYTRFTDGIPDVLRETKVGVDYVLSAYANNGGKVAGMVVGVNSDSEGKQYDHSWWGRPEFQDGMPRERGGPMRIGNTYNGMGANLAGRFAAGLAFFARRYAPYDSAYAARALALAISLYSHGKANLRVTEDDANHGDTQFYDEMALAAVALLWATGQSGYRDDLFYNPLLGSRATTAFRKGNFAGGWFCYTDPGPQKGKAHTSWASFHTYALWGAWSLLLNNDSTAVSYGFTNTQRAELTADILYALAINLGDISSGTSVISLPATDMMWKQSQIRSDPLWGSMWLQENWMYNRYQSGNMTEVFCYWDIARQVQGEALPDADAATDWKVDDVQELLLKQMGYVLGKNPWDICMVMGIGARSPNHPHLRVATPELQNVPGAFYSYRPPVGALAGGTPPDGIFLDMMGGESEAYKYSEVSLDATTALFLPVIGLAGNDAMGKALTGTATVLYVGTNKATIEIHQSRFGGASVVYGEGESIPAITIPSDSAAMQHRITLTGLTPGTRYRFFAELTDMFGAQASINNGTDYFEFTTAAAPQGPAQISSVKVCRVTSDSAEIFWYTANGKYGSLVGFGETLPPARSVNADVSGVPASFHYVKIGGLKEQTTYFFYVESDGVRDDNNGAYYSFTTPVEHVTFDVRTASYFWGDKPGLGINVINQDVKSYDSLELRLYLRATQSQMADFGARVDIGIKYNSAGYQDKHFKDAVDAPLAAQKPQRIDDTFNPVDSTWAWYLRIPLGETRMESAARFRLDILFVRRNLPWNDDLLDMPPSHLPGPGDWSFGPHSRALGDPVDFAGVPAVAKEDLDADLWSHPINPYITVYRKDAFVWGYSPSSVEQATKQNHYVMLSQVLTPLTNPSEVYVRSERTVPEINVTGWAQISDNGELNDIWVNGVRRGVSPSTAVYNTALDRYDFSVVVPVHNGSNVVDITLFAGPDAQCSQCYGCAVSNHHFVVEFKGAELPDTTVAPDKPDTSVAPDTTQPDTPRPDTTMPDTPNPDTTVTPQDPVEDTVVAPHGRVSWVLMVGPNPFSPEGSPVHGIHTGMLVRAARSTGDGVLGQLDGTCRIIDNQGITVCSGAMTKTDTGMLWVWDGRNENGRMIGSGSYLLFTTIRENGIVMFRDRRVVGVVRRAE